MPVAQTWMWSSLRDDAYNEPGRAKLTQWPVAKLKAGDLMRKRKLPRPCKRRKSGAPHELWRTHETWRRLRHPARIHKSQAG
jgi:hypothetical protein